MADEGFRWLSERRIIVEQILHRGWSGLAARNSEVASSLQPGKSDCDQAAVWGDFRRS